MPRSPNGGNAHQGSKWITKSRRLRIYKRDGFRCVWCEARVLPHMHPSRVRLRRPTATLDHVTPRKHGGSNATSNLITSCGRCNTRRGELSILASAYVIGGGWFGASVILDRIASAISREAPP